MTAACSAARAECGVLVQGKTATECSYLEGGGPDGLGSSLRHITLYHSSDGARGRGVLCLLLPPLKRCLIVVVVPTGIAAKEVAAAVLDRAWREVLQGMLEQGLFIEEQVMTDKTAGDCDEHFRSMHDGSYSLHEVQCLFLQNQP